MIHSGEGALPEVKIEPTFGKGGSLQPLNFKGQGRQRDHHRQNHGGGDADEDATIITPGEVTPKKVQPQANGDLPGDLPGRLAAPGGDHAGGRRLVVLGGEGDERAPGGQQEAALHLHGRLQARPRRLHIHGARRADDGPPWRHDLLVVADPASNLGPQEADLSVLADSG